MRKSHGISSWSNNYQSAIKVRMVHACLNREIIQKQTEMREGETMSCAGVLESSSDSANAQCTLRLYSIHNARLLTLTVQTV